jgi:hypothetical protein
MTNLTTLTTSQLRQIIAIKEQIEKLEGEIDSIAAGGSGGEIPILPAEEAPKKRRRSAAVRARMAAAQRARWAEIKGTGATDSKPAKRGKRRISAAGRAAMSAAGKARWAKVKGTSATPKPARKDWRSSPEVRAKLSAAAKLRWAKARAEGKTRL